MPVDEQDRVGDRWGTPAPQQEWRPGALPVEREHVNTVLAPLARPADRGRECARARTSLSSPSGQIVSVDSNFATAAKATIETCEGEAE